METKQCKCGKSFLVPYCRKDIAKYCSVKCCNIFREKGQNKGKKIPKGSLAKMGSKNPQYGIKRTPEQRAMLDIARMKRWEGKRKTKEEKRLVRSIAEEKRRALKKKLGGSYTVEQWENLIKRFEFKCPMCDRTDEQLRAIYKCGLTADHIVPIKDWEEYKKSTNKYYDWNDIKNIQPLCVSCNSKKSNKYIYIFSYNPFL